MSKIKEQFKKLTELAKKYGYEIKHTHALEIISQLELGVNRHVALKEEATPNREATKQWLKFCLDGAPKALKLPFFEAYVLEIGLGSIGDGVEFIVTPSFGDAMERMGELAFSMSHLRILTAEDLNIKVSKFSEEELAEGVEPVQKTILEWIMEKHENTKEKYFTVFSELDDY